MKTGRDALQAVAQNRSGLEGLLSGSMGVRNLQRTDAGLLKESDNYSVKTIARAGGGLALVASRHRLQRWGSYVSHIAIVVILLGAMMRSLLGFETFLPILEGRSANVAQSLYDTLQPDAVPDASHPAWLQALERMTDAPHRLKNRLMRRSLDPIAHWELWVDKLTVDFYLKSTTPSTFASRVRLYNYDQSLAETTIRVNQPLDVNHVRFYQASWGVTGMIRGAILRVGNKTISAAMKGTFPIPDEPWMGRVEHYLPDFIVGPDGQPSTASLEWKHPALVIGFYNKKNIQIGTLVLGAPSPVTPPNEEPWGMFFFAGGHLPVRPPFHVLSVEPVLFSGVQVNYDPGFPVIVTGVLSMLLGLCALLLSASATCHCFFEAGDGRGESQSGRRRLRVPAAVKNLSRNSAACSGSLLPQGGGIVKYYPIFLNLKDREVLLVGAGDIGLQKIKSLLPCEARIHVVAPEALPDIEHLAKENRLRWDRRAYASSDLEGKSLVIAATDDKELQKRIAAEARARGIWVNIVDVPPLCDFIAPAIVDQGRNPKFATFRPAGAAPALAKFIRRKIEPVIGPEIMRSWCRWSRACVLIF